MYSKLSESNKKIEEIENNIKESKEKLKIFKDKLHKIKDIKDRISNFSIQYKDLESDLSPILQEIFNIDPQSANEMFSKIIKFEYDLSTINSLEQNIMEKKEKILSKLKKDNLSDEEKMKSLYYKLNIEKKKADLLQSKLDEPAKKYQIFLKRHKDWSKKHEEIKNNLDVIREESEYIEISLKEDIKKTEKDRKKLSNQIFELLEEKKCIYKELYKPVINFIEGKKKRRSNRESEIKKNNKEDEFLNFAVDLSLSNEFINKFLSFIDRGRKGSFQGITESKKELEEIINKYNFSEISNPLAFLEEVLNKLKNYEGKKLRIEDQLVKGRTKLELCNFLFCLNFVEINFILKWGNKSLLELSPGERGMLLLIFYLLIDNNDWPLIIDQPEENLDNQSVFLMLVPYIKKAKVSRQLILVTHNPNIAVVCDAEQIIIAEIQKHSRNKVLYTSGSIESSEINKKLLNILEGTKPAFENRGSKYIDLSF